MAVSRLTLALDAGLVNLPENGGVAVFTPTATTDISALPTDRVEVIQGFFPDHQYFAARGYRVAVTAQQTYGAAVVFLPRSKAAARGLIAAARVGTAGGPVIVDGQKTDGIDSILKGCRAQGAQVSGVFAKAHGKIFAVMGGNFSAWANSGFARIEGDFVTQPGVFSADGIDRGSAALAAALPAGLKGRTADLGAGWGYLAHHILARGGVTECHLIEAEHAALDCARRNVTDPRALFHWADARDFAAQDGFDHIVTNPPFHTGRKGDPDIGRTFISAAARLLSRRGVVWLVANRHLPYEHHLSAAFKEVAEVAGDRSFKVFRAAVPRPQKR